MRQVESRPIVTVDAALFTLADDRLCIALQRREAEPFKGAPALIGGYVRPAEDEDGEGAIARILKDKAGLTDVFLEQLMTFSGRDRDPRGWSVSIVYYALAPPALLARASASAPLEFTPVDELPELPFDHARVIAAGLARLRRKGAYSNLPALLLPAEFTFPELKAVYERVMGVPLNDSAFRRKISELKIIEPVPEARSPATAERKRPAQLYRLAWQGLAEWDRTL
jgi:8-oxo-dGTP diphosphatase